MISEFLPIIVFFGPLSLCLLILGFAFFKLLKTPKESRYPRSKPVPIPLQILIIIIMTGFGILNFWFKEFSWISIAQGVIWFSMVAMGIYRLVKSVSSNET